MTKTIAGLTVSVTERVYDNGRSDFMAEITDESGQFLCLLCRDTEAQASLEIGIELGIRLARRKS
jgi:predicted O-methyltransferase YrrM